MTTNRTTGTSSGSRRKWNPRSARKRTSNRIKPSSIATVAPAGQRAMRKASASTAYQDNRLTRWLNRSRRDCQRARAAA